LAFVTAVVDRSDLTTPEVRADVARARLDAGKLQGFLSRGGPALANTEQAVAEFRALAAEFPANAGYRAGLAHALTYLGSLFATRSRTGEAVAVLAEAVGLLEALARDAADPSPHRAPLASARDNLVWAHTRARQWQAAEPEARQAVRLREQV